MPNKTRKPHAVWNLSKTLPPVEVEVPATKEQQDQVASDEGSQDSEIPPSMVERDAQRFVELIADTVCAVRTVRGGVVDDVAGSAGGEEFRHVVATILAGRCGEAVEFHIGAGDREVVELVGHQARDEPCESGDTC